MSWENLWAMKVIRRCFQLISGLRVNFHKSKVIGINIQQDFQLDAEVFLNCKGRRVPFKYLGLPIGADPRKLETWTLVLDSLKNWLSSWKRKHLSIGGRVALINSVLNSLPTYFLSFFKDPKKVINSIVSIQRKFLWGGCEEKIKIAWVKWETICLPKKRTEV